MVVTTRSKMKITQNQPTESMALIGSNDDLLTEILLRLPASSILRFKSVSKHWRMLLSHKQFTIRFDRISKSPGLFIVDLFGVDMYAPFRKGSTPPFRNLNLYSNSCHTTVLQSCNGLLLIRSVDVCNRNNFKYYVFNPTTKQQEIIPSIPGDKKINESIRFMGLAFHQTDCVHYKVVCIHVLDHNLNPNLFQIQIYSSDTRKWKISIKFHNSNRFFSNMGVYYNGAIFWDLCDGKNFYFKIDNEQLQSLEMIPSKMNSTYLGESRGHLHLILREHNSLRINLYEMLSDNSGWLFKYKVELDEDSAFREMIFPYMFEVIDMVRGEKEEDTFLVMKTNKIIIYNVHDKTFKQIFSFKRKGFFSFYRYIETLSSF